MDYKKILFPVDLSETSVKIFPHVVTMASKFGAELWLLYVAKVNDYFVEGEEPGAGITKKVKEYKDEYFRNIPDSHLVVKGGEPSEEILSFIEAGGIDMVIMATRGRTALGKAVFGSVAAEVARVGLVPVFLVNAYKDK